MKRSTIVALVALGIVAATFGLIFLSMHDSAKTPSSPESAVAVPPGVDAVPFAPAPPVAASPTVGSTAQSAAPTAFSRGGSSAPAMAAAPAFAKVNDPAASTPRPTRESAMVDIGKAQRMIHDYHTLMGENPVGTNAEIMKALMAGNARQATLAPLDGQVLNDKGELVDPWGTPYFFHQLSADLMEIHSAGPDKVMGTADDLNLK